MKTRFVRWVTITFSVIKSFPTKAKKPIKNFLLYRRLGCENPNVTLPLPKSIILLAFFSRYPLHFDLLVSGTDTKNMVSKKSLRSNITIMESLNPVINYGLNG